MAQLVKYDVHTTRKIKPIHAIFITYYYCLIDIVLADMCDKCVINAKKLQVIQVLTPTNVTH